MLEVLAAHVEQALPRHGRVLHAFLLGHQRQNGIHQARLARRARALNHHRQRLLQLPARRRQVRYELVRLFPDDPCSPEVLDDPRREVRIAKQSHRLRALLLGHPFGLGHGRLIVLCALELERLHDSRDLATELALVGVELVGRVLRELHALPRRVEIHRIDEVPATLSLVRHHHIHSKLRRRRFARRAQTPAPQPERREEVLAAPLESGWRWRHQRLRTRGFFLRGAKLGETQLSLERAWPRALLCLDLRCRCRWRRRALR